MKTGMKWSGVMLMALILGLGFNACNQANDSALNEPMDDTSLIEAIQASADKEVIDITELPDNAVASLQNVYPESYTDMAFKAGALGYEVTIRKASGSTIGEAANVYFATSGRKLFKASVDLDSDTCEYARKMRMGKKECFDFIFPINYTMPDSSVITVEGKEGYETVKNWYAENPEVRTHPSLQLPISIVLEAGDTLTITTNDELIAVRNSCMPLHKMKRPHAKNLCFELVYPVDFTMPDGTLITVEARDSNSKADIKGWYDANPDVKERPSLVFPVQVMLKSNDSIVTVASKDEMDTIKELCHAMKPEGKRTSMGKGMAPFTWVYPIAFEMPDSSEIVLNEEADHVQIKAWYDANPEVKERAIMLYPVSLNLNDGTQLTFNDADEMKAWMESQKPEKGNHMGMGKKGRSHKGAKR